jgi:hypothetical protein
MLYIIGIPQHGKPTVWSDNNPFALLIQLIKAVPQQEDMTKLGRALRKEGLEQGHPGGVIAHTLDIVMSYLRTQDYCMVILEDDAAALHAYATGAGLPPHQSDAARAALGEALMCAEVLTSRRLTREAEALALGLWREHMAGGLHERLGLPDGVGEEGLERWVRELGYLGDVHGLLIQAAAGDAEALAVVRSRAGLAVTQ